MHAFGILEYMTTYNMYLDVPALDVGAIDRNQLISALYLPYMRARKHTSTREKKNLFLISHYLTNKT